MEYALIFLALIVAIGFALVFHKLSEKPKQPDINVTVHVPQQEIKVTQTLPFEYDKNFITTDSAPDFRVDPIEYMNRAKVEESHINVEDKKLDK